MELLLATPKQYCINRPSLSLQTKHTTDSYERTLLFIDAIHIDDDKRRTDS